MRNLRAITGVRYTHAMTRVSLGFHLTLIASTLAFAQDKHVDPAPPHIYHVGEGVSQPKATFSPTPEYTVGAAKKKIEGTVLLSLIVFPDGTSRDVTVIKGLGYGLDEQAVKAVSIWRFQPAVRQSDGEAIPISITVETTFNVYHKKN
jgi:TonB family protein